MTDIDTMNNRDGGLAYQEPKWLGDLSAVDPWHSVYMECVDCNVAWAGCWDNYQCPRCLQGELPWRDNAILTEDEANEREGMNE